ncbi:MAG: hypothetical protein H7328_09965 [Bdellovibrio sp.]|nr:hypothetical protein [Bdellovibrio sp.]
MIILALIALVVIPPDKLPEFAKQIARLFNDIRRSTSGAWDDLKQEAMLKPEDLMKYKAPETKPTAENTVDKPVDQPVQEHVAEEKKPNE